MHTLDELPVVATATQVRHNGELLGVQFLPDGIPCYWGDDELIPIPQLEWAALPSDLRRTLRAAIQGARG